MKEAATVAAAVEPKETKEPKRLTRRQAVSRIDNILARLPSDLDRRKVLEFLEMPHEGPQVLVPGAKPAPAVSPQGALPENF